MCLLLVADVAHADQLARGVFDRVVASIPECKGAEQLRALARSEAERMVPKTWAENLVPDNSLRAAPPSPRSVLAAPQKRHPA